MSTARLALGLSAVLIGGALALGGEEVKELSIPLTVVERAGVERVNEPVTFGVPLPDGAVKAVGEMGLYDADGRPVPSQMTVANKWWHSDTIKWLHLTVPCSVPAGGKAAFTLKKAAFAHKEAGPMAALEDGRVTVDTGAIKFVVNGARFNLFDGAWVDDGGKGRYDDAHMALAPGHDGGFKMMSSFFGLAKNKVYTSWAAPAKVEVLENGALRCVIKVSGRMTSADDLDGPKDPIGYECYIYAYRNWPAVRLTYAFHVEAGNELKDYVPLDGIYLDLPTRLAGNLAASFGKKGGSEKAQLAAPGDRAWLEVESGSQARGGGQLALAEFSPKAEKPRELGWAQLASDRLSVNVGVKWFWNLSPKSLELSGDGRVRVGLWPNVADEVRKVGPGAEKALFSEKEPRRGNWYTGMSKTHEILVGFGGEGARGAEVRTAERQFAWLADRLWAEAPTAWYCQGSKVWGRLADSSPELFDEAALAAVEHYDKQMRGCLVDVILKRNDKMFGQWDCHNVFNWGDHVNYVEPKYDGDRSKAPQSVIHWDNGYYGFAHALIVQWARTGDPVFLTSAEAFATHIGDIDTVWWAPKGAPGASRYCAGPMHITMYEDKNGDHNPVYRSGTFNHFKLQEHFERYYLFGDWQARDVGLRCEQAALALGTGGVDWGQSRSMGHGLLALTAGYLATGEAKYLDAARKFVDAIAGGYKKGRRVQKGQWWQGGIALEALREFWEQTGYEPAHEVLESMTRDMIEKGIDGSCIHAAAWYAAQKDDAALAGKVLDRFAKAGGYKDSWGSVMHYGNNQRNTGYVVWYLAKDLPKKDEPIKVEMK